MRKPHFRSCSVDIPETLLDNSAVRGFYLPCLLCFAFLGALDPRGTNTTNSLQILQAPLPRSFRNCPTHSYGSDFMNRDPSLLAFQHCTLWPTLAHKFNAKQVCSTGHGQQEQGSPAWILWECSATPAGKPGD